MWTGLCICIIADWFNFFKFTGQFSLCSVQHLFCYKMDLNFVDYVDIEQDPSFNTERNDWSSC